MRDLTKLIAAAAGHGTNIGIYAERVLDDPMPWTRMRAVYRLSGLVRCYGPEPVEAACSTSLDLDVVSVTKIVLERARIGRSGVGLGRVVSDLLEREGREFGGEFA